MCKHYYIEVTDLTDLADGREQLQQAGVAREHILVVDTAEDSLTRAIREVTGVGMDGIAGHSRERGTVSARTMYVHFALLRGDSVSSICERLHRPRNRIRYYEADYEPKVFGDREFKIASDKVQQMLNADPSWEPARFERRQTTSRSRRKRRKRIRKLVPKPRQPKDTLQLKIDW